MLLAASTQRSIGFIIFAVLIVGFLVYLLLNSREARSEVGSELDLAANRKPYLDDSELEGSKLDRALLTGLVMLVVISVGTTALLAGANRAATRD